MRFQLKFSLAAIVAATLLNTAALRGQVAAVPQLTVGDIYGMATERQKSFRNVKVEYTVSWKKLMDVPSRKMGAASLVGYDCVFAIDGERRYLKRNPLQKITDGAANIPTTISYDGKKTYVAKLGAMIVEERKSPGCENGEYYCREILQIPLTDEDKAQYDNAWFYPHCLRPNPKEPYIVSPQFEQVDGANCYVLFRAKRDKIWVDPQLGGAYRRRERYSEAKGGEELLICRYECSDFVEVASIWVPKKCIRVDFAPGDNPPSYWNKPFLELHLDVKTISINQVTDDDFNVAVAPGTNIIDKNGSIQVKGDKTILLNELADLGKLREPPSRSFGWFFWISLPVILLLGGILTYRVFKKYQQGRHSQRTP
jgi:hypothetical protein